MKYNKIYSQRSQKLADFMKTVPPEKYNQTYYGDCKSPACVGGWSTICFSSAWKKYKTEYHIGPDLEFSFYFLQDYLGLTSEESNRLTSYSAKHTTPAKVSKYIEKHFINRKENKYA